MKFGEQLRSSIIRDYQWHYIDYDGLKKELKAASGPYTDSQEDDNNAAGPSSAVGEDNRPKRRRRQWTEDDEQRFIKRLYGELDKVYTKTKVKQSEIQRLIASNEQEVRKVVDQVNQRGLDEPGPSEESFVLLEENLSDIIADVHDLAKFVQLNYTGFYKILKKHDKMTQWHLRPSFDSALKKKPFYNEDFDAEVVKLSKLYDLVRTKGNPVKGDSAAGGAQGSFVRQTTKYWVHPDNVTEVKLIILKHLPVLVFNASKEFETQDSAITSIYYDNPEKFDLYEGRLKKTEGAEAIRLRWYGGMQQDQIFVERKTHREDWTGEQSVKARFSMKEKNVNAYMRGDLLPEAIFEKARKEGKKPAKVIDEQEALAREVQYSVLKKGYKPVCRSFYNRTAFQLPADARVRISLDTELTMVREDNSDGVRRCGDNWRRMDIGIDWPFSQLPPGDVVRFPYAVLEVKLQTQHGQEAPEWMDVDIRKEPTHDFGIRRLHSPNSGTTSDDDEDDYDSDVDQADAQATGTSSSDCNVPSTGAQGLVRGDVEGQTVEASAPNEDYPIYDSDDESDEEDAFEEARRVGGWTYYSALAKRYSRKAGSGMLEVLKTVTPRPRATTVPRSRRNLMFFGDQDVQTKKFKSPKGKKIYVPVRVEPKVYFAAERTFLGWLEVSIYLGTIAVTLLNFGTKPTMLSFAVAGVFTLVAVLSLCYSVGIYLYRSKGIRERKVIKYYDRIGPSVLCAILFLGIALNFVFEGRDRQICKRVCERSERLKGGSLLRAAELKYFVADVVDLFTWEGNHAFLA
ncbi:hypothetical protein DL765_003535 [Monosporascus sp. GIB2]|nr:hypothetical protein DL765_003535 [Monosporascus sp. GIB2]